ncbi:glucose PTS transporter subunit IIA [Lactobacillus agrestimuris]|uniref:glucose PTS transporter subunit IIA n=1 Tax=Lactobacillus agrestimuris TaxID=2941328 RepID=UPI00204444E3|nr:glucose PTS transporter subunit IIA [Lactobacillus agrestimuris]
MGMDYYQALSLKIYQAIGGIQNVNSLTHCVTRLKISVRDLSKVDVDALKKIDGVLGVIESDTLEVVLGLGINSKVAEIMNHEAGVEENQQFPNTVIDSNFYSKKDKDEREENRNEVVKKALRNNNYFKILRRSFNLFILVLLIALIGFIPVYFIKNKWPAYLLGLSFAYIGSISSVYLKKYRNKKKPINSLKTNVKNNIDAENSQVLYAPITGYIEELSSINDHAFSKKMLGDGFAIIPTNGKLLSPISGVVSNIMSTKHAMIIKSNKGRLEILLHLGLNTAEMNGRPFKLNVVEGESVSAGQIIAEIDIDAIKKAGKDPIVITTITNMDEVKTISNFKIGKIIAGKPVLRVINKF